MVRLLLLVVPLAVLAGCKTENPEYCKNFPGTMGCPGEPMNGGGCGSDGDCNMPGFPACELTIHQGTCEPCSATNKGVCKDTKPHCEKNACVACVDDVQDCQGGVCLDTGGCADPNRIIHARSNSTMMTGCGDATNPCSLTGALMLVTPGKDVIKLDDSGPYVSDMGVVINTNVTIDARGATLHRSGNGAIVTVKDDKSLTILGGTIENAQGGGGDGIKCGNNSMLAVYDSMITGNNETGINGNGCTAKVTHAKISNNSMATGAALFPGIKLIDGSIVISRSQLISNRGGGITVNGNSVFTIVGNMFLSNGDSATGPAGGFQAMTPLPGNRLEFNTFAGNMSVASVGAGIQCQAPSAASTAMPLVAQNNIIWNNNGPTALQVLGSCTHSFSDIGEADIPTSPVNLDGGSNFKMNPMFVGTIDLEVNAGSPIRGKGNPAANLDDIAAVDINGVARTVRPGAGPDPGAYVVPEK